MIMMVAGRFDAMKTSHALNLSSGAVGHGHRVDHEHLRPHRAKVVGLRLNLKRQIHTVLAGAGVTMPMSELFEWVAVCPLSTESPSRVDSLLWLITALDFEIEPSPGWWQSAAQSTRLHRDPVDPRGRPDTGRGVRRRDRRHHAVRASAQLGIDSDNSVEAQGDDLPTSSQMAIAQS
jgi:hypothetical protein